jgi:hypothetical protein
VSEQQQQSLEDAIVALATMAQSFAGMDQFVLSRLASARHDLQQHLEAEKWNDWRGRMQQGIARRKFAARHKSRRVADHA